MDWKPISSAPDLDRIMVCGWQRRSQTCQGYWWYGEDCAEHGRGIEHPDALYWCPLVLPAKFPEPPTN